MKLRAGVPEEGATGLSDNWMIGSRARHPNCMYMWMNYIVGPEANAAVAEHTAQAPANEHACDLTGIRPGATPTGPLTRTCSTRSATGPPRCETAGTTAATTCKTYDEWARAFARVMAGR